MNKPRRLFLSQLSLVTGAVVLNKPLTLLASNSKNIYTACANSHSVIIYHTNHLRGEINPVYKNMGGINNVRALLAKEEAGGLMLDGGNFLNGESSKEKQLKVIQIMNDMGYLASSPGRYEFKNGQAHLAELLPLMKFKLVNCNYNFDESLRKLINPYLVINTSKFKVGITGVGPQLDGVNYNDAIQCANKVSEMLKEKEKCDLVVCISQLDYEGAHNVPGNVNLIEESEHIDMIIGDKGRKIMGGPMTFLNKLKRPLILSQAAPTGLMMAKTAFNFDEKKQHHTIEARYLVPGQPEGQLFRTSLAILRAKKELHSLS
ncbi:MAG: 5-nucleotidase [Mucilaginibacter sp.]|nr:5-nucleotidase [Mucilaginibacter sp.]